jgi:hypothetical protein
MGLISAKGLGPKMKLGTLQARQFFLNLQRPMGFGID